jgi:hypothetical protein
MTPDTAMARALDGDSDVVVRSDWRDSLALAADLALLGIVTMLASIPVVTAGAALATASAAADHVCVHRELPRVKAMAGTFWRALWPGLGAVLVFAVAVFVLAIDLRVLAAGVVPGSPLLLAVTIAVSMAGLTVALLALVRVGATGGRGWLAAVAWAARRLAVRPWLGVLLLLVVAVPAVLALAIPVTTPLLIGFLLFALHVTTRRDLQKAPDSGINP